MRTIITLLILLMPMFLTAQKQEFHYSIDGLDTRKIETKLPGMTKEEIFHGMKYFVNNNFGKPIEHILQPVVDKDSIVFPVFWQTGAIYWEFGIQKMTGNIKVEIFLTAKDDCYLLQILSVRFLTKKSESNALQKNSKFYKLEGRTRFKDEGKEVRLDDYLNATNALIKEYILRSKHL